MARKRKRKRHKRGAKKKGNKKKKQKNNNPKMIDGFDLKDLILADYARQRRSLYKRLKKSGDFATEKLIKDEVTKDRKKGNHLPKVKKTAMKNVSVTKHSVFGYPITELVKPENRNRRVKVVAKLTKMGGHQPLLNKIGQQARLLRAELNGGSAVQGKKKSKQPTNQPSKPKAGKKKTVIEYGYGQMEIDWGAARQYKAQKEGKVMQPESTAESLNKSLADYMGEAHSHRVLDSEICAWFTEDQEGDALMQ